MSTLKCKNTMNYDEQIQALLDQNEASKMLAKVGLKIQSLSTNRDFQLLVAEYSTKVSFLFRKIPMLFSMYPLFSI